MSVATPPRTARAAKAAAPTPTRRARLEGVDAWLARHRRVTLMAILLVAALVRIVYFREVSTTPLRVMHQWDQTDMAYYDFWARRILAGDWLSRDVPPPLHIWHKETAEEWLRLHPELKAALIEQAAAAGVTDAAAQAEFTQRAVWKQWVGPKLLYQEPAYPYLLALTYRVFGDDVRWVFAWQMLLGLGSIALVYHLALARFGALAAAVAGLGAALAAPTLMFEATLLRDTLITFLGLLLVLLADRALARKTIRSWLALGLCLGCSLLVKGTFMLFGLGVLGLLAFEVRRQWKRGLTFAAALAASVLVALSPVIVRNLVVGAPPLALAGKNAVPSFVQNNLPDYTWSENVPYDVENFPRVLGEANGSLLRGMRLCFQLQPHVRSILWIFLCKFDASWHWWDRPDNINIYYYQLLAPALRLPITFWAVAVPGLVGLGLSLRQWRRHATLYLLIVTPLVQMVLFSVMARYRLPILMALLPFAAFALVQLARWGIQLKWQAAAALGAMLAIGAWTGRPMAANPSLIRCCDATGLFRAYYEKPLDKIVAAKEYPRASEMLEEYLRFEPPVVKWMDARHPPRSHEEAAIARVFFGFYQDAAQIIDQVPGRRSQAMRRLGKSEDLFGALNTYRVDHQSEALPTTKPAAAK
jgi:4-amino-4-deoxy-L-arabinose transferase-like glycosyltransferase